MAYKNQCLLIIILMITSTLLQAGGYQVYEQANPAIGTANAGQAAYANDASTAYFNPAGMTRLDHSLMMVGIQVVISDVQFRPDQRNSFSGTSGGEAGALTPGAGIYGVSTISPDLKFGLSLTAPYGGVLSYTDGWVGRYFVQDTFFLALNINPALAYRVNDWLSVGGGASIEYALLHQNSAIFRPNFPQDDGQVNLKLDNYAGGVNLGLLLTPSERMRIGLAWRSKITHKLKGRATFLRLDTIPAVSSELIEPQNIILSSYFAATDKLALVGELGWGNWSALQDTFVQIQGLTLTATLAWKDTYHFGGGFEYQYLPQLKLQAGAAYDSSPTNASRRVPQLPVDRQIRVGTGLIYTTKAKTKVGFQMEYVNFGAASIHHATSAGSLSGSYGNNNYAIILASNVNFDL